MPQLKVKKPSRREKKHHEEEVKASKDVQDRGRMIAEKADELIDEIDEILQKNPEEFVKAYVQKGGE